MAARPRDLFTARVGGQHNVQLNCHSSTHRVLGATVPVGPTPGESATMFMVHLPEGQDRGLVAVASYYRSNGDRVWAGYILEITRDGDGKAHVELDHSWVPEGQQIVQIDHLGIHVTDGASGDRFTTDVATAKKFGWHHVPDGDLLVACLAGTKTVDDVRAAVQAQAEERSARERLAEIEPKMQRVQAELHALGIDVANVGSECRRLQKIELRARAVRDHFSGEGLGGLTDVSVGLLSELSTALQAWR